jgi:hypothetical protein
MLLDLKALAATPVSATPYAHVVVRNFVPPETLRKVVAEFPLLNRRGSFPIEAIPTGPTARAVMDEMKGSQLRDAIARKFDLDLSDAPVMITLRGRTEM